MCFELVEKPGLSIATPPQLYSPSSRTQASVITRLSRPSQRQPFPSGKNEMSLTRNYDSFKFNLEIKFSPNDFVLKYRTIFTATLLCTEHSATSFNPNNWITLTTISCAKCDSCIRSETTTISTSTTH